MPDDVVVEQQPQHEEREVDVLSFTAAPPPAATVAPTKPDIEIQVVDDVPVEQKPRIKPENYRPNEADKLVTDEELRGLSDEVKNRFKRMTFQVHEAERQRQELSRQREEAVQYGKVVTNRYQQLQQELQAAQRLALQAAHQSTASALQKAKQDLTLANQTADFDKVSQLTEEVGKLAAQQQSLSNLPIPADQPIPQPPAQGPPPIQEKDQQWLNSNAKWFRFRNDGAPANPMTSYAMAVHDQIRHTIQPGTDQYYQALDGEMRQRFPEMFPDSSEQPAPQTRPANGTQRRASVVAPVVRTSPTGRKTVQLTPSALATARLLGVDANEYARMVATMEDGNG